LRMFYAFADSPPVVWESDTAFDEVVRSDHGGVWHRTSQDAMGGFFFDNFAASEQVRSLRDEGVLIVYVARDRDCVIMEVGDDAAFPYLAHDSCEDQALEFIDDIAIMVDYEGILVDPNGTQKDVAAALGLTIRDFWSTYPAFVPPAALQGMPTALP